MIEAGAVAMALAAIGAASYAIARSSQRARVRRWLHAARSCGVQALSPVEVVGYPSRNEGGVTAAEPHLIRAVDHDHPRVRIAAAHALARMGTIRAVLPLQQAAQRFGGELGSVSRQAVARIQARAVGATPGQLSLSATREGHVSLADDPLGQVSMPDGRSDR